MAVIEFPICKCGHAKGQHTFERGFEGGCVVCACAGYKALEAGEKPKVCYGVQCNASDSHIQVSAYRDRWWIVRHFFCKLCGAEWGHRRG